MSKKKTENKKRLRDVRGFRFFLQNKTVGQLVGKSILLLVIPYAYLFLCGFIFDRLLRWYFMTTFIFVSLIVLYILAIAMIVGAVKVYKEQTKNKR